MMENIKDSIKDSIEDNIHTNEKKKKSITKHIVDIYIFIKDLFYEVKLSNLSPTLKGALDNYKQSNSSLWVASLCYFSIMGFIPILAILFSIARWLNFDTELAKKLIENSPMDKASIDYLQDTIQNLLSATKNGVLAGFGFFFLGFSVISMFSIIERAFNSIWQIKVAKNFRKKIGDYFILFVSLTIILFIINRVGHIDTGLRRWSFTESLISHIGIWIFFILFYIFIPNTKVEFQHTIISGFLVSLLLNQSNFLLIRLQSVILKYNRIYGSFSVVLLVFIWIKVIWFIILIGAHFTFILQNRNLLRNSNLNRNMNYSSKFTLVLAIFSIFIENFKGNHPAVSQKSITKKTSVPEPMLEESINFLKDNNIIVEVLKENNSSDRYFKLSFNCDHLDVGHIKELFENYGQNFKFNNSSDFEKLPLSTPIESLPLKGEKLIA